MSIVTNVILTTMVGEELEHSDGPDTWPRTDAINTWLANNGHPPLLHASDLWRGQKCMEAEVFIGAFNYLDAEALRDVVRAQDWDDPEAVQLFINQQEDLRFEDWL